MNPLKTVDFSQPWPPKEVAAQVVISEHSQIALWAQFKLTEQRVFAFLRAFARLLLPFSPSLQMQVAETTIKVSRISPRVS